VGQRAGRAVDDADELVGAQRLDVDRAVRAGPGPAVAGGGRAVLACRADDRAGGVRRSDRRRRGDRGGRRQGDRAAAYLCDGSSVETWLQGSVTGDQIVLTGRDTAALIGTISGATLSGTVVTSTGQAWLFSADEAPPPAGIYEARTTIDGLATRIGWVVLPDGTQVGVRNVGGNRSPAPRLDLDDNTFTLDGAAYEATPIDGTATVVGR
jgi:hypothetical protein